MLGGCSLRGGEGSIVGILLGTTLLQVLQNLVNLLGIPSSLDFAVMGGVILDRRGRRSGPAAPWGFQNGVARGFPPSRASVCQARYGETAP